MKVIACIEDPLVVKKILTHVRGKELYVDDVCLPQSRAPPQGDLFSWDIHAGPSTHQKL